MLKYAKKTGEHTYDVGLGTSAESIDFYTSLGMELTDVEQGVDGNWYDVGYAPTEPPEPTTEEKLEALDAQYQRDKDQLMQAYLNAMLYGDTEQMETLKADLDALDAKYDKDYEAIIDEEG